MAGRFQNSRVSTQDPSSRDQRMIMEATVKRWLRNNVEFPYPQYRQFLHLRMQIHTQTGNPTISDRDIRNCLARARHIHWPMMVYEAGLIPLIHRPTQTMWARSEEYVRVHNITEGQEQDTLQLSLQEKGQDTSAQQSIMSQLRSSSQALVNLTSQLLCGLVHFITGAEMVTSAPSQPGPATSLPSTSGSTTPSPELPEIPPGGCDAKEASITRQQYSLNTDFEQPSTNPMASASFSAGGDFVLGSCASKTSWTESKTTTMTKQRYY